MKKSIFFLVICLSVILTACAADDTTIIDTAISDSPTLISPGQENKPSESEESAEETEKSTSAAIQESSSDVSSPIESNSTPTSSLDTDSQPVLPETPRPPDISQPTNPPTTSQPSVTEPPATEPPVTEAPVTKPPATDPPQTTPPETSTAEPVKPLPPEGVLYSNFEDDEHGILKEIHDYAIAKGFVPDDTLDMDAGYRGRPNLKDLSVTRVKESLKYHVDRIFELYGPTHFRVVFWNYQGKIEYIFLWN